MAERFEMATTPASPAASVHIGDAIELRERVRATDPLYLSLLEFLWEEAAVLDSEDLTAWQQMLDENIRYRMPVCLTRRRGSKASYETEAMHFDETYHSLRLRIRRIIETLAWANDPASRTRRMVTTVRAWMTADPALFRVMSSLLLVRTQDDEYRTDLVTAQRTDLIRQLPDGSFRLLDRKIVADQTTIGTHNLAIFL
jgi:3-phenylpropionate/cinnamic acid dioxygenase small subunit